MKLTFRLLAAALLALIAAVPGSADDADRAAALANHHLTAISLARRWSDALYHLLPPEPGPTCEPSASDWVDNGDGTFSQDLVLPDCTTIHITSYGGSPSDYDELITHPDGTKENLTARTVATFNGGPARVHFLHTFSSGERIEYDEELQQDPARDEAGTPIEGLNFWYALITRGTVTLKDGSSQEFELRQTKAFDCTNIFTGVPLPDDICGQWFELDPDLQILVPRPDRLRVSFRSSRRFGHRRAGTFTLAVKMADPAFGIPDLSKEATGGYERDGVRIASRLLPNGAEPPDSRWDTWLTTGKGFRGRFSLGADFSGQGQAVRSGSTSSRARRGPLPVEFIARWDRSGVGTVVVARQATERGSPFAGALEFGQLKWSGLAAAFGPAPGL